MIAVNVSSSFVHVIDRYVQSLKGLEWHSYLGSRKCDEKVLDRDRSIISGRQLVPPKEVTQQSAMAASSSTYTPGNPDGFPQSKKEWKIKYTKVLKEFADKVYEAYRLCGEKNPDLGECLICKVQIQSLGDHLLGGKHYGKL